MIADPHSTFGNNSQSAGKQHHHENETILRDLSCQALATFCAPKPSVKRETPRAMYAALRRSSRLGGVFPVVNRLRLGADWRCDARARPVVFLLNSRLLRESRKRVCVWT